jgi:hypothetical protein
MKKNNHNFTDLLDYYNHVFPYPIKSHTLYSRSEFNDEEELIHWIDYGSQDNLYFVMNPLNLSVKIGITNNFENRYAQLCSQSGLNLIILAVIGMEPNYDERAKIVETHLHNFFYKKRLRGEWFNLSISDLRMIRYFLSDKFYYDWDTDGPKQQMIENKITLSDLKKLKN